MGWNRQNTILIMETTGFLYDGCVGDGFRVYHPYKKVGIIRRLLRELCFRLPLLPRRIWFDESLLGEDPQYIFLWDPLITAEYLKWLQKSFPRARIYFIYGNMVGKCRHLLPREIPGNVSVWTYDAHDSEEYGLRLFHTHPYYLSFLRPKQDPEFDVFFVGRDKGRGEWLLDLERQLRDMGLKTKFIITADGRFSPKKPYYQPMVPYSQVLDYLTRSRAVLNVTMDNQRGITMRDIESVFFNIKLISTNPHLLEEGVCDPRNVFLLGSRDLSELPRFVREPAVPADPELLRRQTMDRLFDELTGETGSEP